MIVKVCICVILSLLMSQFNKVSMNVIKNVLTFRKLLKKIYSVRGVGHTGLCSIGRWDFVHSPASENN